MISYYQELKLNNFVFLPRYIASDYRNGKISIPERNLWLWMRSCVSPYGIVTVSMETLAKETFNKPVDKNYINKILISLKSKRYIWYSDRTGRRGSFEIHMGDLMLPSKTIKTLDRYFDADGIRGEDLLENIGVPEVETEVAELSQSFNIKNTVTPASESREKIRALIRGLDNDKEKDKNNDKESLESLSNKKRDFSVGGFIPESVEEQRCLNLATKLGDAGVGFYYGTYKKYGMGPLEKAWEEFKKSDGYNKDNPPAFFNSLVQLEL